MKDHKEYAPHLAIESLPWNASCPRNAVRITCRVGLTVERGFCALVAQLASEQTLSSCPLL
jgi:hypothetical protein